MTLIPDGSDRSREGDKSKMELGEGRMDHWCTGGPGPSRRGSEVTLPAGMGGTKVHAWDGSMYKSRRDEGGFMTFALQSLRIPYDDVDKYEHIIVLIHPRPAFIIVLQSPCSYIVCNLSIVVLQSSGENILVQ